LSQNEKIKIRNESFRSQIQNILSIIPATRVSIRYKIKAVTWQNQNHFYPLG